MKYDQSRIEIRKFCIHEATKNQSDQDTTENIISDAAEFEEFIVGGPGVTARSANALDIRRVALSTVIIQQECSKIASFIVDEAKKVERYILDGVEKEGEDAG